MKKSSEILKNVLKAMIKSEGQFKYSPLMYQPKRPQGLLKSNDTKDK